MNQDDLITMLRAQADAFERKAKALRRAADELDGAEIGNGDHRPAASQKSKGRLAELQDFLRVYGPMRRGDIAAKSGIPLGTLAMLLVPRNFDQELGKWKLKEEDEEE